MKYTVEIQPSVLKYLGKLPDNIYKRLRVAIFTLPNNPRPHGSEKMTGRNAYKIRVGDYRIIYEIEDKILLVTVIHVGHRREVYKNK